MKLYLMVKMLLSMCILQGCAAVSSELLPWFVFSLVELPAGMMEIMSYEVCMAQTFAVVAHQSWDVICYCFSISDRSTFGFSFQ